MATRDTGQPASGITRRDFLKTAAAATAVAGCGLEFAFDPAKAEAYENSDYYTVTFTTCPYCSASCGQRVVVANDTTKPDGSAWTGTKAAHPDTTIRGKAVDLYGDFQSPWNSGGLCAKGAGSLQLVNNPRRVGAWDTHGTPVFAKWKTGDNGSAGNVAYKRTGNGSWGKVDLNTALGEIATGLKAARGALDPETYNSKGVAFFGCSHMNNESNYIYRKLIADFGTSNVEHQARI